MVQQGTTKRKVRALATLPPHWSNLGTCVNCEGIDKKF